jgi:hypothetical protein
MEQDHPFRENMCSSLESKVSDPNILPLTGVSREHRLCALRHPLLGNGHRVSESVVQTNEIKFQVLLRNTCDINLEE